MSLFRSLKAMFTGIFLDVFLTFTLSFILTFFIGIFSGMMAGGDTAATQNAVLTAMQTPGYVILSMVIGAFCTLCGGYRAASSAPFAPLVHAGFVGFAATFLSLPVAGSTPVTWVVLITVMLAMPSALIGGLMGDPGPARKELERKPAFNSMLGSQLEPEQKPVRRRGALARLAQLN